MILRKHDMVPSMSRPANPYDNASCESFIKTLKREEIYAKVSGPGAFTEQHRGVHRALLQSKTIALGLGLSFAGEFEQDAKRESRATTVGATVRFFPPSGEKDSTVLAGEGTQTPSLPHDPCWRINKMVDEGNNVGNCGKLSLSHVKGPIKQRCKVSK